MQSRFRFAVECGIVLLAALLGFGAGFGGCHALSVVAPGLLSPYTSAAQGAEAPAPAPAPPGDAAGKPAPARGVSDKGTSAGDKKLPAPDAAAAMPSTLTPEKQVDEWGMRLFRTIRKDRPGKNSVVYTGVNALTLSVLGLGASEGCEEELQQFTGFAARRDEATLARLSKLLLNQGNKELSVQTASSIWLSHRFKAEKDFIDTAVRHFGTEVLPLSTSEAQSAVAVNNWFRTKISMDNIVKASDFRDLRLMLGTATRVKGEFERKFLKAKDKDFTLADGKTIQVPMMHGKRRVRMLARPDFHLMAVPTKGGAHLVVGIPAPLSKEKKAPETKRKSLDEILPLIDAAAMKALLDSRPRDIDVSVPVFHVQNTIDLKTSLARLGLSDMFRPQPGRLSLARISKEDLFVGLYRQKARLAVTEAGFEGEGAEVLGVTIRGGREEVDTFLADVPFYVRGMNREGLAIFSAGIEDPRDKGE